MSTAGPASGSIPAGSAADPHATRRAHCRVWNKRRNIDPVSGERIDFGSPRYIEWYNSAVELGFISWTERQKINSELACHARGR